MKSVYISHSYQTQAVIVCEAAFAIQEIAPLGTMGKVLVGYWTGSIIQVFGMLTLTDELLAVAAVKS